MLLSAFLCMVLLGMSWGQPNCTFYPNYKHNGTAEASGEACLFDRCMKSGHYQIDGNISFAGLCVDRVLRFKPCNAEEDVVITGNFWVDWDIAACPTLEIANIKFTSLVLPERPLFSLPEDFSIAGAAAVYVQNVVFSGITLHQPIFDISYNYLHIANGNENDNDNDKNVDGSAPVTVYMDLLDVSEVNVLKSIPLFRFFGLQEITFKQFSMSAINSGERSTLINAVNNMVVVVEGMSFTRISLPEARSFVLIESVLLDNTKVNITGLFIEECKGPRASYSLLHLDGLDTLNAYDVNVRSTSSENGAILLRDIGIVTIEKMYIRDTDGRNGGGLLLAGIRDAKIIGSTFSNNLADYTGAAIAIAQSKVEISHSIFENNAAGTGGAISVGELSRSAGWNVCSLKIINGTFKSNAASYNGGCIFFDASPIRGLVYVENSTFYNNSADYGGALYVKGWNNVTMKNTHFNENSVNNMGGAFFIGSWKPSASSIQYPTNITLEKVHLKLNSGNLGGAVTLMGDTLFQGTIDSCEFWDNSCPTGRGGGLWLNVSNTVKLTNSLFQFNSALEGAALYLETMTSIVGNRFLNNTARMYGGAFLSNVKNATKEQQQFIGNTFVGNDAQSGKSIYIKYIGTDGIKDYWKNVLSSVDASKRASSPETIQLDPEQWTIQPGDSRHLKVCLFDMWNHSVTYYNDDINSPDSTVVFFNEITHEEGDGCKGIIENSDTALNGCTGCFKISLSTTNDTCKKVAFSLANSNAEPKILDIHVFKTCNPGFSRASNDSACKQCPPGQFSLGFVNCTTCSYLVPGLTCNTAIEILHPDDDDSKNRECNKSNTVYNNKNKENNNFNTTYHYNQKDDGYSEVDHPDEILTFVDMYLSPIPWTSLDGKRDNNDGIQHFVNPTQVTACVECRSLNCWRSTVGPNYTIDCKLECANNTRGRLCSECVRGYYSVGCNRKCDDWHSYISLAAVLLVFLGISILIGIERKHRSTVTLLQRLQISIVVYVAFLICHIAHFALSFVDNSSHPFLGVPPILLLLLYVGRTQEHCISQIFFFYIQSMAILKSQSPYATAKAGTYLYYYESWLMEIPYLACWAPEDEKNRAAMSYTVEAYLFGGLILLVGLFAFAAYFLRFSSKKQNQPFLTLHNPKHIYVKWPTLIGYHSMIPLFARLTSFFDCLPEKGSDASYMVIRPSKQCFEKKTALEYLGQIPGWLAFIGYLTFIGVCLRVFFYTEESTIMDMLKRPFGCLFMKYRQSIKIYMAELLILVIKLLPILFMVIFHDIIITGTAITFVYVIALLLVSWFKPFAFWEAPESSILYRIGGNWLAVISLLCLVFNELVSFANVENLDKLKIANGAVQSVWAAILLALLLWLPIQQWKEQDRQSKRATEREDLRLLSEFETD